MTIQIIESSDYKKLNKLNIIIQIKWKYTTSYEIKSTIYIMEQNWTQINIKQANQRKELLSGHWIFMMWKWIRIVFINNFSSIISQKLKFLYLLS